MKTAKEILNGDRLSSVTINSNAMVLDAFNLMESEKIDYVVVVEGNNCVGIISEVDYMHKVILARKDPDKTKVKEIMSSNLLHAVDIDEPVYKCLELMDTFTIRHLLVFETFLLKGVITLHDLIRAAFEENVNNMLEQEQTDYTQYTYITTVNNLT